MGNGLKWTETTEERYEEMLNILPPAAMAGGAFLVGEPAIHDAEGRSCFDAFAHIGAKFYASSEPMSRATFRTLTPASILAGV